MSDATALMLALIGPGADEAAALDAIERALEAEVDPLHWCVVHRGIEEAEAMRRGAEWAGLAFFPVVPRLAEPSFAPNRLEVLAEVRMFRLRVLDRDVAFAAPDFFGFVRLARARRADPGLRQRLCLVPASALRDHLVWAAAPAMVDHARQNLGRHWPHAAAQLELTGLVRWGFALGVLGLVLLLLTAPAAGQVWVLPLWGGLVVLPALLRLLALAAPAPKGPAPVRPAPDRAGLPTYSILVPLREEANMVDQLAAALGRLDYPAEKLQIIFVVEARSRSTVAAVRRHLRDPRFSLVEVPDAAPRTKPKALDFALPLCRGEFVVVYDAEDRPDPGQLLGVVEQFRRQPEIECVQARLVIANARRGLLPTLFAGEYAGLFGVLLPALAHWDVVMPLGGTSNHFRLATLRRLGGWDAFNVTEDADLGVRLARRGLRTATSTSHTLEDAPEQFGPWLGQRTRWMKGWMQTYLVHTRRPRALLADLGWRGFLAFQILVLGMILAPLLHLGFLLSLTVRGLQGRLDWTALDAWAATCIAVLVVGHGAAIAANIVGLRRSGQSHLWPGQLLLPAYWLLIAWATLRALLDLARRPFHWFKTPHRVARSDRPWPDRPPRRPWTLLPARVPQAVPVRVEPTFAPRRRDDAGASIGAEPR